MDVKFKTCKVCRKSKTTSCFPKWENMCMECRNKQRKVPDLVKQLHKLEWDRNLQINELSDVELKSVVN